MDPSQRSMLHAAKWNTASNIISQILISGVTLILAGLLTPSQFGVVAIAYLYITFIQQITGFGFNSALIQHKSTTNIHLSSVFWLNILTGSIFAVISIFLSRYWAHLNSSPELTAMICAASISIPIEALSVVQIALLQKKMDFKRLAIRDNVATGMGGLIGVASAICGLGGWALILQHVATDITALCLLWRLSEWRPEFVFSWKSIRELSNYSLKTLIGRLGTFAQNNTDNLVIGIIVGPSALGIYRLANRLIEMNLKFVPRAIQVVSLPHFSKFQSDLGELNKHFLFGTHINSMVSFPTLSFMAGAASLILSAIGPQWSGAVAVLKILTLTGIAKTMILLVGPLLQAVSRPGVLSANLWLLALSNIAAVLLSVRLFPHAGDNQKIAYVAAFRSVLFLCLFLPLLLWHAKSATGLSIYAYLKSNLSGVFTGIIIYFLVNLFVQLGLLSAFTNRYSALLASAILGIGLWLICLRWFEREAFSFLCSFCRKKSSRLVSSLVTTSN